jgi:hypothetical protein
LRKRPRLILHVVHYNTVDLWTERFNMISS